MKKNEEIVETLGDRILGRVSLNNLINPSTGELIIESGNQITDSIVTQINDANIESIEVRSPLSCEAKRGICAKCYGRNLATGRMVQ